ncbi:MAG TPA: beta-galactosidase [Candidatus Scybalocola faecavium]|nr:beta-galactosidase [Candidatus Scybalocola faecavium]
MTLGTCYYPEQWPKALWAEDLKRMKDHGIEVIRIAEFAWTIFEPEEGRFSFEFFDEFMELAKNAGMKVIFCTPTATLPAWLTDKYLEVLNCDIEGNPYHHGARRHYNYSSPIYRRLCANIVEQLALHYGQHPAVIGWQIDNELNCELNEFYGPAVDRDFNQWVQEKYKTLEALNQAWGTVFWNQTYTAWEQIHVPGKVVHNSNNPHQMLDYVRFVSDRARSFANIQSRILRQHIKPADFITTNGFFSYMDNHALTRESLDFYTYDSYPDFAFALCEDPLHSDDLNDRKWSKNLARMRSISPIFGIMEQQSGANGWNTRMEAPAPKPGQMTLWAMQSIAHGADFVSFFRWRTSVMGTEIYWHGILDYSGRDNRRLRELGQIRDKTKQLSEMAGAVYKGSFAALN